MPNRAHFISKPFKIFLCFTLIYHSVLISHSLNAQNFSSFSKLVRLLPIFMPLKLFLPCWDSFLLLHLGHFVLRSSFIASSTPMPSPSSVFLSLCCCIYYIVISGVWKYSLLTLERKEGRVRTWQS